MVHLAPREFQGLKVSKELEGNLVNLVRQVYQALLAHADYQVPPGKMELQEMMGNKVHKAVLDSLVREDCRVYQECQESKVI